MMIELMLLKELMLIKQLHQKSHYLSLSLLVFLKYSFNFQPNVCNRCHDLFMMSINLSDIVVLNIKGSDHRCIISLIGKNEAIKLLTNADLTEKSEKLQKKWKIANEKNI